MSEKQMRLGALEAGGTKMVCAVVSGDGEVLDRMETPTLTPAETVPQMVEWFIARDVDALGIGAFGPTCVDPNDERYGSILQTPKLAWRGYGLRAAFADALGIPLDMLGITVCSVGGTNFTPYVKLLGPEGLNIPHVILTDRDPTNGNHPLVRRRLINVLDVIEGGVDHENLDADEVIELAEQYGYFVNENTLEPELFAGGLAQDMQEVIREELPRLRRETLNALQQWVDDPDQVDEDWLLRLIERIGKGRFAQALAPSVSQDVCPAYIRSALEHIRDAIA